MNNWNFLLPVVAFAAAISTVLPCEHAAAREAAAEAAAAALDLNKAVTRRVYEEGLNQGRFQVPYTADFVGHGGRNTFTHDQGMAEARGWRDAFPDLHITVERQVAENDLVAVHWTARGTNTGTGNGIPATGKAVEMTGTTLFRMDGGRIAEEWTCANSLGLMRQLGLVQMAATPASANSPRPRAEVN